MLSKISSDLFEVISHKIADRIYSKLGGARWGTPPDYAYIKLLAGLGIDNVGEEVRGGTPMVLIVTRGGSKFLGPVPMENWNCSPRRVEKLKKLIGNAGIISSVDLSDAHYALIDNIINRYVTEFSAYPFQAWRTQNLRPGDTFLDIGAFRGYVSLKASQKIGREGFVCAIEPMGENVKFINEQFAINGVTDNHKVFQAAVTNDDSKSVEFFSTVNQVNSCLPDHLTGEIQTTDVVNISTSSLVNMLPRNSHDRVIASITTNGSEMEVAKKLLEDLVEIGVGYAEITIPIIFTRKDVKGFLTSLTEISVASEIDYPWLKVIYQR